MSIVFFVIAVPIVPSGFPRPLWARQPFSPGGRYLIEEAFRKA
jgi:hypothetical protein